MGQTGLDLIFYRRFRSRAVFDGLSVRVGALIIIYTIIADNNSMGGYNNYYDVSFVNDNCIGHDRIGYACVKRSPDRRV